ncbi:hypothetical protein GCK72_011577 [Caenorhabditis remanei]|nr:hypothetical protein GCK72_011576 [Caenorhabditis remanei]XP_053588123.1 hypothetical protein GCK72_011577 [Caenorhabditis remanei]KAF1763310.1 hypothetical protein GCK72_011576 [Caenorhabditis remanei]KAF1763311.1 hypothetical protein GCK72_011577 [Caenorhabditis remanei]
MFYGTIIGYQFHREPYFLFFYFYYIVFFYFFLVELITVIHGDATLFVYDEYEYEEDEDGYPRKIRIISFQQPGIYYEEYP